MPTMYGHMGTCIARPAPSTSTSSRPHCVVQFLDATCPSPPIHHALFIRGYRTETHHGFYDGFNHSIPDQLRSILYYSIHKRAEDTQTDTRTTRTPRYGAARNSRTAPLHFVSTHCTPAACRPGHLCSVSSARHSCRTTAFFPWLLLACWALGYCSLTGVVQTF